MFATCCNGCYNKLATTFTRRRPQRFDLCIKEPIKKINPIGNIPHTNTEETERNEVPSVEIGFSSKYAEVYFQKQENFNPLENQFNQGANK